nr:2-keto-3-deoxygluconate permease [Carnobacterium sp. CS13]
MNKIPAGTFLVPMLLSALLYTLWPNLFSNLGGITNAFLGGSGTNFIIGLIFFVPESGSILKHLANFLNATGYCCS